jgi:hypothetical protein
VAATERSLVDPAVRDTYRRVGAYRLPIEWSRGTSESAHRSGALCASTRHPVDLSALTERLSFLSTSTTWPRDHDANASPLPSVHLFYRVDRIQAAASR